MIKESTLTKKLASYSTMASLLLIMDNTATAKQFGLVSDSGGVLVPPGQRYYLDLDKDGSADFVFTVSSGSWYSSRFLSGGSWQSEYISLKNNASVADLAKDYVSVFNGYDTIGPGLAWKTQNQKIGLLSERFFEASNYYGYTGIFGKWHDVKHKYAGLRIKDGAHYFYGWARLSVAPDTLIVESYAINPIPDSALIPEKEDTIQPPFIISQPYSIICRGDSAALQLENPVQNEHLQWYFNGQPLTSDTDSNIIAKSAGYYFLTKTFDALSFSLSNSISIGKDSFLVGIFESGTAQLYAVPYSDYPPFTYQWFLNGEVLQDTNYFISPTQTGIYQVIATDRYGYSKASGTFYYVFTGISSTPADLVKLYSSNRKLFVQLPDLSFNDGSLEIMNTLGQLVLQERISSENFTVNLESFEAGIYFVRLEKNGKQMVKKIIVQ